jgi:serine/threonine-protein kinase
MDTDRNLLFAVLALQADLIDREQFVQACTLWAARKDIPIAELLIQQGWLTPEDRSDVDRLLARKLKKHGGDVQASLAEAAGSEARGALASVADADVEHSVAALSTAADRPADAEDYATVPPGDSAGRNLLYEEIGRGGIGRVLRGRDPDLRRDLAVKVLRDEYRDDAQVQRRFVEEAQVGGQLQHPGVVPVYELGRFADRRPYFTMKLVKGRTLADLLKERPDPGHDQARFVAIFEQVCQTVAYAHSKGVIHRDLKPSNVMVGAFGEVQVMDWGLAKVLGQRNGDQEATTAGTLIRTVRSGSTAEEDGRTGVVGTPAYMAPEQARGEAEAADERADVFGLGAILCVILTGRPPQAGADREEVLRRAAAGDLAETFARLGGCGADAELIGLARRCLAARPEDRPRGAGAVAAELTAYREGVEARLREAELGRARAQVKAQEEAKRRRVQLALAAALLLLLLGGSAAGLAYQRDRAARAADRAARQAETERQVTAALQEAATLTEQGWGQMDRPERWQATVALAQQAVQRAQGLLATGVATAELEARVGQTAAAVAEAAHDSQLGAELDRIRLQQATLFRGGQFDRAAAVLAYRTALAGYGVDPADGAATAARVRGSRLREVLLAALEDWAQWTPDAAERERLNELLRAAEPEDDAFRAQWRAARARHDAPALAALSGQPQAAALPAATVVRLALELRAVQELAAAERLLAGARERSPGDFWLNEDLGLVLAEEKRWGEAARFLTAAVALRPDSQGVHYNLGLALRAQGDVDGAIRAYRRSLDLDPEDPWTHTALGNALHVKGDVDGAIREYRRAIDCDPKDPWAHFNLGGVLHTRKKDVDGAIQEYRRAIDCDPKFAHAHNNLGWALYEGKKDVDGAIQEYRRALDCDPKYAHAHYNLGNALDEGKKDVDGAIQEYRRAIDCDPKYAHAHNSLGWALYTWKKDVDGAIQEYRRAIDCDAKYAAAHYNLGNALYPGKKDVDGAIQEYRRALDLDPAYPEAHCNLGHLLRDRGDFAASLAELRRGHQLGSQRPGWPYPSARWVQDGERLLALDQKLPAVLSGEAQPADPAEAAALASLCARYKERPAAAARLYADAFATDPKLAADLRQQHRYNAACNAAMAAAGQAKDAEHLPDKARLMLRRQALHWLREDLAAYRKMAERQEPAAKQVVRETMRHWQQDTDLASVRDPAPLDQLSDDERQQWHQLWQDVAALLKKVDEKK